MSLAIATDTARPMLLSERELPLRMLLGRHPLKRTEAADGRFTGHGLNGDAAAYKRVIFFTHGRDELR